MRKRIYIWIVILLLALAAGFLAACSGSVGDGGGETGAAWDPGTAADAESGSSTDGGESKEEYLPEPGDFVIGTMRGREMIHQGLLSDYALASGVKIEIKL